MANWESLLSVIKDIEPRKLTNKEKEEIIAKALKTPEGRQILSEAVGEHIRKEMNRLGVHKKLLFQDN